MATTSKKTATTSADTSEHLAPVSPDAPTPAVKNPAPVQDESPQLAAVDKIFDTTGVDENNIPEFQSMSGMMPVERIAVQAELSKLAEQANDINDNDSGSDTDKLLKMIPIMERMQGMLIKWAADSEAMETWLRNLPGDGIREVLAAFAKLSKTLGN